MTLNGWSVRLNTLDQRIDLRNFYKFFFAAEGHTTSSDRTATPPEMLAFLWREIT